MDEHYMLINISLKKELEKFFSWKLAEIGLFLMFSHLLTITNMNFMLFVLDVSR